MESTFASRVKQFRQHKGLSQQAFAEQCDLAQGNIAHMESGTEPKQSNVSKLIAGFPDLNPDWLLNGTGTMLRDGRALAHAKPTGEARTTVMHPHVQPADKELTSGTQNGPTMFVNDAGTLEGHWKMIAEERAARLADKDQEIERLMQQLEAWQEAFRKPLASAEAAAHLTYSTSTPIGPRFDSAPANMWVNREPQAPQVVELEEAA